MPQVSTGLSRRWSTRMRAKEASEYLLEVHGIRLEPSTLAKLRCLGGGPSFQYDGRFPVYTQSGCDTFALRRLGPERTSTSDMGEQMAA